MTNSDRLHSDVVDRPRLVRLALQYSVIDMSRLPDVPDAEIIYQALASDSAFEDEFGKANTVFKQARRTELAELLRRSRTTDLSRIFVALRKLRARRAANSEQPVDSYDLTRLTDEELSQLETILLKALPQSAEPVQTQEGTGNDEHTATPLRSSTESYQGCARSNATPADILASSWRNYRRALRNLALPTRY